MSNQASKAKRRIQTRRERLQKMLAKGFQGNQESMAKKLETSQPEVSRLLKDLVHVVIKLPGQAPVYTSTAVLRDGVIVDEG